MAGFPAGHFCIKAFSETDQTEDLKKFDVPTLILQGDDDQIVPCANVALLQAKLTKNATLKIYSTANPYGLPIAINCVEPSPACRRFVGFTQVSRGRQDP